MLAAASFAIRAAVVFARGTPASGLANAAAGALVPVLLAALSARLFRRRGLAIVTGGAGAVLPVFGFVAGGHRPESFDLVLLLGSAFLLLVAADRPSSNFAVLSGATLALAVRTQSSAWVFVPFLAAPLFDRRYPRRIGAHVVGSAILGLALVLGPVLADAALAGRRLDPRSWLSHGDPSPGAYGIAMTVLLGPLAAIGLARAERRGAAWFCVGILTATMLVLGIRGTLETVWTSVWDPILLLYGLSGAFGAVSLARGARELESEAA